MSLVTATFESAFQHLPLVAILRGVRPDEVEGIALGLYQEGYRVIEVPLNSPGALESIARLSQVMPADALIGAGTVLSEDAVHQVRVAGGRVIVMPHADLSVIKAAKLAGMYCIPGVMTPTEAFAAFHAGADALKLFPAELITIPVLKAIRAVLPKHLKLLPVGGVTPENMPAYLEAGAAGFGLGSGLYKPGMGSNQVIENGRNYAIAVQSVCR